VPTPLAEIVTDFLVKYFGEIMDYDFTASAEKELDE
jgi:DNA topoisomerase-1